MFGTALAIPPAVRDEMTGVSWQADPRCPPFEELALLRVPHWDFAGAEQVGELVVAAGVADAALRIFAEIYRARFPIARMERIDRFGGDDDASMTANNASAFNFRFIAGTNTLSNHALGLAIDINPVQNPWVRGDVVQPEQGREYLDRGRDVAGMIRRPGAVTAAFDAEGWYWGGDWSDTKDYHHFSAVPR